MLSILKRVGVAWGLVALTGCVAPPRRSHEEQLEELKRTESRQRELHAKVPISQDPSRSRVNEAQAEKVIKNDSQPFDTAQRAWDNALANARKLAQLKGYGPEQTRMAILEATSIMHSGAINSMLGEDKIDEARKYFEAASTRKPTEIDIDTAVSLQRRIRAAALPRDASRLADELESATAISGGDRFDLVEAMSKLDQKYKDGAIRIDLHDRTMMELQERSARRRHIQLEKQVAARRAEGIDSTKSDNEIRSLRREFDDLKIDHSLVHMQNLALRKEIEQMKRSMADLQREIEELTSKTR